MSKSMQKSMMNKISNFCSSWIFFLEKTMDQNSVADFWGNIYNLKKNDQKYIVDFWEKYMMSKVLLFYFVGIFSINLDF